MDKKVLVIGASGLVGSALMRKLQRHPHIDPIGTYLTTPTLSATVPLDIEDWVAVVSVLRRTRPVDIYVPAYISNVDACEKSSAARQVNVTSIVNLCNVASTYRARIIFFSSSYVFDGKSVTPYSVWDKPHPIQQYGIQKLLAEKAVLSYPDNVVVRTVGVFGEEVARKNFACHVLDSLSIGTEINVPEDQMFNPIVSDDLAVSTVSMVDDGFAGLLHIAGQEVMSKYDFAHDIAQMFSLDRTKIHAVSGHKPGTALRPKNGCLQNSIHALGYEDSLKVFYNAQ